MKLCALFNCLRCRYNAKILTAILLLDDEFLELFVKLVELERSGFGDEVAGLSDLALDMG